MECVSGEGQYWSNNNAVGAITWPIVKFWSNICGRLDKNELKTGKILYKYLNSKLINNNFILNGIKYLP